MHFLFSPRHEGHTHHGSHSWSIRRIRFILQEYLKYIGSNFCCPLVLSRTLCGMINIIGNKLHPDFRPPTLCRRGFHSPETFRCVRHVTDVSGPYRLHIQLPGTPKTILLGPLDPWRWNICCPETSGTNYRLAPCNIAEEPRIQTTTGRTEIKNGLNHDNTRICMRRHLSVVFCLSYLKTWKTDNCLMFVLRNNVFVRALNLILSQEERTYTGTV
jgi:hypothetical protein